MRPNFFKLTKLIVNYFKKTQTPNILFPKVNRSKKDDSPNVLDYFFIFLNKPN